MKILFLDFDGPLWSDRVIRFHPHNTTQHPEFKKLQKFMEKQGDTFGATILTYWKMDEVAVNMLNRLMEESPFHTVISSSWREFCSRPTIEYIFQINGLQLELHDDWLTPIPTSRDPYGIYAQGSYADRSVQIYSWVREHKDGITDYVILDDPDSGGLLAADKNMLSLGLRPSNIILVNPEVGMEIDHFQRFQTILSVE